MRKRTRKHRGTAGKMVGGFLAFFCLILLTAGMFWAIQGYVSYQKAVKEKPLAQAVEEARSGAQWDSLEQVPDLYKKAVLAVEDHRYYTHHGIDWISMARWDLQMNLPLKWHSLLQGIRKPDRFFPL